MRDDRTTHHERALIGLCILDPGTIDRIEIDLAGYSFTDPHCIVIWPVLFELRRKGFPITDVKSLANELRPLGVSAAILVRLCDDACMRGQEAFHASVLVDRMRLMRMSTMRGAGFALSQSSLS